MKYQLIIFDFDGTLADSMPWFLRIYNEVAGSYKFKRIEEQEVDDLRSYSARQMIQRAGVPWWKLPLIARQVRALTARDIGYICLFEGVAQVIERLSQQGIALAIVTSNSDANVRQVLGPNLASRITYYQCGVSLFGKRPRFLKVLKQHGVSPREALCIGDEIRDLEASRAARIPFGAVAWG